MMQQKGGAHLPPPAWPVGRVICLVEQTANPLVTAHPLVFLLGWALNCNVDNKQHSRLHVCLGCDTV